MYCWVEASLIMFCHCNLRFLRFFTPLLSSCMHCRPGWQPRVVWSFQCCLFFLVSDHLPVKPPSDLPECKAECAGSNLRNVNAESQSGEKNLWGHICNTGRNLWDHLSCFILPLKSLFSFFFFLFTLNFSNLSFITIIPESCTQLDCSFSPGFLQFQIICDGKTPMRHRRMQQTDFRDESVEFLVKHTCSK